MRGEEQEGESKKDESVVGGKKGGVAEGEVGDLGHALNLHCVHCLQPTK